MSRKVNFGPGYARYLSEKELEQELDFAMAHLDALFSEYKKRVMSGSKKVRVEYLEEVEGATKAAAAIR